MVSIMYLEIPRECVKQIVIGQEQNCNIHVSWTVFFETYCSGHSGCTDQVRNQAASKVALCLMFNVALVTHSCVASCVDVIFIFSVF